MKTRTLVISIAAMAIAALASAMVVVYQAALVNEPGLAYNNNYTLDTFNTHVDYVSAQAVYSKGAPAAVTFTDGAVSTMSLTVASLTGLTTAYATNKISVVTNSALTRAVLTFNGTALTEGTDWSKYGTSSDTAKSLYGAISRRFPTAILSTWTVGDTVIYTTATSVGSFANAYTMTSSTQAALSVNSATFAGGKDNALIAINGTTLINGTNWFAFSTASATAKSISDAIAASSALNTLITSTWTTAGVVTATSSAQGASVNYSLLSSTQAALTFLPTTAMTGGSGNNINTTSNAINKANTFTTALAVLYTKTAGTSPANLIANTTYYAIAVDANNFKLATSSALAIAGTPITISTTATGGGSFTMTPLAFAGTPGFKWQASNDGVNFNDLATSSVSFASPYTSTGTLWDMGAYDYRYLRLNVTGPTAGALNLVVTLQGKNTTGK